MTLSTKCLSTILLLFTMSLSLPANSARAEVTGWITPDQIKALSGLMKKEGLQPLKMECRGDSRSTSVRESMEIRMTYGPKPAKKSWRWAWGADFGLIKRLSEKAGYRQVSESSFIRPKTGLLVRCGIFHK